MSGQLAKFWWNEPGFFVPGLLNVIGATLGGDSVLWFRLDRVSGQVILVDIVEPNPAAREIVESVRISNLPPPESLGTLISNSEEPFLISRLENIGNETKSPTTPWSEYFSAFPIIGIISVPTTVDDGSSGVLVTIRRTIENPYTVEDLRYVESGARRLAGRVVDASLDDTSGTPSRYLKGIFVDRPRILRFRDLVIGAGPPALIMVILNLVEEYAKYRPATLLLMGCVFAAVFGGLQAAILSGVISAASLWWAFTPVEDSWRLATPADAIGIGIFLIAIVGVIWLVLRLDEARRQSRLERLFSDSLLEDSPLAMAVFDRELKFRRVNRSMAEMNGRSVAEHVGFRPGDISPLAGQMYEHLLLRVRDSGEPINDHKLKISSPEIGLERDWNLNLRPLRNLDLEVVGVGITIMDTTLEVETLRHAEQLFHLAESLSTAFDDHQIAASICSFLVDTFHGRSAVAFCLDEELVIHALSESGDKEDPRWRNSAGGIADNTPLGKAVVANQTITLPESVSMPLRLKDSGDAVGAMHIGWETPRQINDSIKIVLGTVSSLATLALARVAASNLAQRDKFRQSLEAMLDDVVIACSERSEDGEIIDFRIEFANSSGIDGIKRDAGLIVDRLVCDVYPNWRALGMFDRLRNVVETGVPYLVDRMRFSDILDLDDSGERFMSLHVAKLGDGYIAASRDVSNLVAAEKAEHDLALQIETERTAIQLLQLAALPNSLPSSKNVRIAAVYEPSDPLQPVGGDWYDAFSLDDDRMALVIADVAGHGRNAAVFMVQVRNVFRALAVEHAEPGEVMIRANNVTTKLNEVGGPFVTCCFAVLDMQANTLTWAQAGHFSPLILHADGRSTYLLERTGPPLALAEARHYESSSTNLHPGDRVMMFTDGLVERRREHIDVGLTRLAQLAKDHAALHPEDFVKALAATVTDRFDDLALMCVELVAGD
ncbi:MAG: SpoIIE family protein phosphatase [Ilumatobacteraceae bacterium]